MLQLIQGLVVKLEVGIERKSNLIFHLKCIPNQRTCLGLTQNLEKHLMKMTLSGLERKKKKVAYQECLKIEKQENLITKEGKKQ